MQVWGLAKWRVACIDVSTQIRLRLYAMGSCLAP